MLTPASASRASSPQVLAVDRGVAVRVGGVRNEEPLIEQAGLFDELQRRHSVGVVDDPAFHQALQGMQPDQHVALR